MSRLDHLGAAMVVGFVFGTWVCGTLVPWLRDRRARRRYTGSTCRVVTEDEVRRASAHALTRQLAERPPSLRLTSGQVDSMFPRCLPDPSPSPRRTAS